MRRAVGLVSRTNSIARGLIIEGMERGIGISVFTVLLMGLVAGLEGCGVLDRIIGWATLRSTTRRHADIWIFATVSAAVLLTTHSVVAILTTGKFASEVGGANDLSAYRRANVLDVTVCTNHYRSPKPHTPRVYIYLIFVMQFLLSCFSLEPRRERLIVFNLLR